MGSCPDTDIDRKCPYTETVQSPNRLVHYALVFRTPATRRNPTNKIEITLNIEQAKHLMWKAYRNGQTK